MANKNPKIVVVNSIFALVAILCIQSHMLTQGRHVMALNFLDLEHNGTVKTIETENGDMIDCVDIYRQPTLHHPLVDSIQMKPSSYPSGMRPESSQPELIQLWHKNEQCPQGTIPIRRTPKHYNYHPNNPSLFHNKLVGAGNFTHEYAVADAVLDENCYGGQASVSVWNPKTELTEFSLSQIWVGSQSQQGSNTIEAGWTVNPRRYHDNMTRFFIYWTGDNYKSTGCYDLDCPGFVQTSRNFAIGSAIPGTSIYGGMPFDITITVYKDKKTGNWWLMVQNLVVGYWPASLFKGFADGASRLTWGGEIINRKSAGHHTTTEMGSGRFSSQGYERSSYFRNVKFIDSSNTLRDPVDLIQYVSNPQCYDLQFMNNTGFGISFFYGGPGYSARCP